MERSVTMEMPVSKLYDTAVMSQVWLLSPCSGYWDKKLIFSN